MPEPSLSPLPRRHLVFAALGVSLVALVAVGTLVIAGREDAVNRDDPADAWVLLGVEQGSDAGAVVLVRAQEVLGRCERTESGGAKAVRGGFRITVRRVREGCDGPQPAIGIFPPTLRVALPGGPSLAGPSISGPGFRGVGAPSVVGRDGPPVPSVAGLPVDVARELLRVNDFRVLTAPRLGDFVRAQDPVGGTERRAGKGSRPVVLLR